LRLVAVLFAAAALTTVAAAGPNAVHPAALLSFTMSPRADPEGGQYLACIARSDGKHRVRIVSGDLSASAPAWSPDGTKVAFTGWNLPPAIASQDESDIVVADARGQLLANLTAGFSQNNFNPKWSPDGRWIAFISAELELTLVPSDGSQAPVVIAVTDFAGDFNWFPNGKRLAISKFSGNSIGVFTVNLDGSGLKLLTRGNEGAISPNGRKLAFVRIVGRSRYVFVANANGSKPRRLSKGTRPEENPSWSPDGRWIAFERTVDPKSFFPHSSIVVMRSNGTGAYVAVKGKSYDPFYPAWRRAPLPKADRASC
jgi:Tol biopolymer transport system component